MATAEQKINILIVDDMPDKLMATAAILDELGQNVITVSSGREALRCLLHQDFAVILLDVNMPGMDGFETAALIRARKKTEQTPIIFVTAYSDDTHVAQGYSIGAVDYILAPVVPEVLRAKVGVFVELYRKTEQVKRQAEQRVALAKAEVARASAEDATRRSNFLAEASTVLARSLDYEATLRASLRLVAPAVADLALLKITPLHGGVPAGCSWLRAGENELQAAQHSQEVLPPELVGGLDRVLAGGAALWIEQSPDPLPAADGDASSPPCVLPKFSHAVIIPLEARSRIVGALCLVMGSSGRKFTPVDMSLAEDLAGRIAIAIDNARLYREIQEGDRRKDEFLAMLGHELRNPLGAIANAIECLAIAGDDVEIIGSAREVLSRQVQQMTRLVDDLLDVSRITRGKVELRKEVVDLATAVARAVATSEPAILARKHVLSVQLPSGKIQLLADPARLEQVLANLLNNAAKYTEFGGQIWLTAESLDDHIELRVRDTGIGIPPNLLPRIFEMFAQGDRSLDRSQGGLGIGLTLVRSLIELHGGRVEAHSAGHNQGSEFLIQLPRLCPEESPPPAATLKPVCSTPRATGRRILCVEDNGDLAQTMKVLLERLGHEVHVRYDGLAAVHAAVELMPDVVLVDIGLPEMDGYEVARRIRLQPGLEKTLLVAMTGYGQADDRRRAKESGFDHHLVKPVRFQTLQDLLAGAEQMASSDA